MPLSRPRSLDVAIITLITAGHIALFWLMSREMRLTYADEATRRSVIVFVPLPAATPPEPVQAQATEPRRITMPVQPETRSPVPEASEIISSEVPVNTKPVAAAPNAPTINWRDEATSAAQRMAQTLAKPSKQRPLDGSDKNASQQAPKAKPNSFEWRPEPKRAGFSGGLPYVRVGKRCVVGLPFIGCAIGKLPEANGELFEHMHDDEPSYAVDPLDESKVVNPDAPEQ